MARDRKEYRRQYYLANREKELKRSSEWRKNNQERRREYRKTYYLKNKQKGYDDNRKWREENPEKYRAQNKRSTKRKLGMQHKRINDGLCAYCGMPRDIMGWEVSSYYCGACLQQKVDAKRLWRWLKST